MGEACTCRVLAYGQRDGGQADQVGQGGEAHHGAQQRQVACAALQVLRAARARPLEQSVHKSSIFFYKSEKPFSKKYI